VRRFKELLKGRAPEDGGGKGEIAPKSASGDPARLNWEIASAASNVFAAAMQQQQGRRKGKPNRRNGGEGGQKAGHGGEEREHGGKEKRDRSGWWGDTIGGSKGSGTRLPYHRGAPRNERPRMQKLITDGQIYPLIISKREERRHMAQESCDWVRDSKS